MELFAKHPEAKGLRVGIDLPAGRYRVKVETKDGRYRVEQTLLLHVAQEQRLEAKLRPTFGLLSVDTRPSGAELLVDNRRDDTVWPLGLLAPLIQWSALPQGSGEGLLLELSAEGFDYRGFFGRPAALPPAAALVRHPIPQDIWKKATRSAAGGALTLSVKVLSTGTVYGPLKQRWTIANGKLRGTVYYQSYGTNLAKNYGGALGGDGTAGSPFARSVCPGPAASRPRR